MTGFETASASRSGIAAGIVLAVVVTALAAVVYVRQRGPDDTVAVGPPGSVTAQWVEGQPVWVVVAGTGDVTVFDAVNPHPVYGMTELVGWCESSGWFEAWRDGSRFGDDGRYAFGPAPHDLSYHLVDERDDDGTVHLGRHVIPRVRSGTDDEPDGPHCSGDGGDGTGPDASYHPVEGSGRDIYEGIVLPDADGVVRFCREAGVPASCPDGAVVPEASSLPQRGLRGRFLARRLGDELHDVIVLPPA